MSVVLPAPVGPTMATVWPGLATQLKSWMMVWPGTYPKRTWSNSTRPGRSLATWASVACSSSGAARNSKTRSVAAAMDCSVLPTLPSCWTGWVKLRTYWMKDWMSPGVALPVRASCAPTTTTPT